MPRPQQKLVYSYPHFGLGSIVLWPNRQTHPDEQAPHQRV